MQLIQPEPLHINISLSGVQSEFLHIFNLYLFFIFFLRIEYLDWFDLEIFLITFFNRRSVKICLWRHLCKMILRGFLHISQHCEMSNEFIFNR